MFYRMAAIKDELVDPFDDYLEENIKQNASNKDINDILDKMFEFKKHTILGIIKSISNVIESSQNYYNILIQHSKINGNNVHSKIINELYQSLEKYKDKLKQSEKKLENLIKYKEKFTQVFGNKEVVKRVIDAMNYSMNRNNIIGEGGYGQVYVIQTPNEKVYVKKMGMEGASFESFYDEVNAGDYLSANIPQYVSIQLGAVIFNNYHGLVANGYIIFEYLPGSDMKEYVKNHAPDNTMLARLYCKSVEALRAMHSLNYVHRDVKPSNIFIHADESDSSKILSVKLIDFGLSEKIESGKKYYLSGTNKYSPYKWRDYNNKNTRPAFNRTTLDPNDDLYAMKIIWTRSWNLSQDEMPACETAFEAKTRRQRGGGKKPRYTRSKKR